MGNGRDPCRSDSEELLCRAIIPRLIFRGVEPIGYPAGALFLLICMDRVPLGNG